MNKVYTKKLIGSAVLSVVFAVLTLTGFTYAQAQSNGDNRSYNVDGEVTARNNDSVTIRTADRKSIVIRLDERTTFTENHRSDDIRIGDAINFSYKRENNENRAKVCKIKNRAGYGNGNNGNGNTGNGNNGDGNNGNGNNGDGNNGNGNNGNGNNGNGNN